MGAWGYEFYLLVLKVSLSALKDKIRTLCGHVISSIYFICNISYNEVNYHFKALCLQIKLLYLFELAPTSNKRPS